MQNLFKKYGPALFFLATCIWIFLALVSLLISNYYSNFIEEMRPNESCVGYIEQIDLKSSGEHSSGDAYIKYYCFNIIGFSDRIATDMNGMKYGVWVIPIEFSGQRIVSSGGAVKQNTFVVLIKVVLFMLFVLVAPLLVIRHWSSIKLSFYYASRLHLK